MKPFQFYVEEIDDAYVRENFRHLQELIRADSLLTSQFQFYEFNFDSAVTDLDLKHGLQFIPLDVITTYVTPGITLTWSYDKFSRDTIRLTTSGACRIRAFIGAYRKGAGR